MAYVANLTARAERDFASLRDDIDAEKSNAALKWHQYRVIYRVLEQRKQVDVLHIRHGARRRFRASEIT
jgi:mRNA-degrading endonuclease RelE of RelBE toxin-antitoxin system